MWTQNKNFFYFLITLPDKTVAGFGSELNTGNAIESIVLILIDWTLLSPRETLLEIVFTHCSIFCTTVSAVKPTLATGTALSIMKDTLHSAPLSPSHPHMQEPRPTCRHVESRTLLISPARSIFLMSTANGNLKRHANSAYYHGVAINALTNHTSFFRRISFRAKLVTDHRPSCHKGTKRRMHKAFASLQMTCNQFQASPQKWPSQKCYKFFKKTPFNYPTSNNSNASLLNPCNHQLYISHLGDPSYSFGF